jgi:hypothetical protein
MARGTVSGQATSFETLWDQIERLGPTIMTNLARVNLPASVRNLPCYGGMDILGTHGALPAHLPFRIRDKRH